MANDSSLLPTVRTLSREPLRPGILKFGKMHWTRQRVWFEEVDNSFEAKLTTPQEKQRETSLQSLSNFISVEEKDVHVEEGYNMELCCCTMSAFKLSIGTAVILMGFLIALALKNVNKCISLPQVIFSFVLSTVTILLLIGLWKRNPSLLSPFLLLCLLTRVFCICGLAITAIGAILAAFYVSIQKLLDSKPLPQRDTEIVRVLLVLATVSTVAFSALSVPFNAVRRSQAVMRRALNPEK